MELLFPENVLWMIIVGFIVAFVLAFGIGANDVANSFGTSVGAKVLTLRQACILGAIFETLGAILLGAKVSDTIRKGIIDVGSYNGTEEVLMVGNICALSGSCIWLLIATFLSLPVSGTHSIVGATLGFALVAHGAKGVNWIKAGMIVGSWFISPVLSGLVSIGLFWVISLLVLRKEDQLRHGLRLLPIFYGCTLVINVFSIFYDGPEMLGFDKIPLWGIFILSFGSGLICAFLVRVVMVPWQRKKISNSAQEISYNAATTEKSECNGAVKFTFGSQVNKIGGGSGGNSADSSRRPSYTESMENPIIMPEKPTENGSVKSGAQLLTHLVKEDEEKEKEKLVPTVKRVQDVTPSPSMKSFKTLLTQEFGPGKTTPPKVTNGTVKLDISDSSNMEYSPASSQDLEAQKKERESIKDSPESVKLFSWLQILTAIFGSFAHGGNDVSNAIGPLVALWIIGLEGSAQQKSATPIWILLYGGVGISIGLFVWGRRVIKTMGEDLTKITPSSGFCIEIGSALTVLVASNIGIPVSTTHCKVGSIVSVGRFRSRANVDWKLFRNIFLAWIVTLPVSGGISAALFAGLRLLVPH